MKQRILGIDTGTNSIGWALVDYDTEATEDAYQLIDKGVHIFQEGVKKEKGVESSRAAERTAFKHQRVGNWRRKLRKIKLLKTLSREGFCPPLTADELKLWRSSKVYPTNEAFRLWQLTDDNEGKNPYYYRHLCLNESLDLSKQANRYMLGRALYHLNQRRGFLSNRKENTKESDGAVKQGIDTLSNDMEQRGCAYLGDYFYQCYQNKEKIRSHYTSRVEHYEQELLAICQKQGLSEELTRELCRIILTQRPLKSQKHTVGKCVFEPSKARCPQSHPLYEQYRMYAFINNIKIQGPQAKELRFLTDEEKQLIIPLFLRKSKPNFKFEEIAKKLAGKGKHAYAYYKDKEEATYRFNYYMDTQVSGCPVIAQLAEVFEAPNDVDEWLEAACEVYTQAAGKTRYEIMNDVWHALFFFEDEDKLKEFALNKLQLDEEHATRFSRIRLGSDYAQLSLNAIRKILPYLKAYGMIYSHAVFMANLPKVVPCEVSSESLLPMLPKDEAEQIVNVFYEYDPRQSNLHSREEYVKCYLKYHYALDDEAMKFLDKHLYHPSMIETYPRAKYNKDLGCFQLGSPRTDSMRNPMAMRSLFRLRQVVNKLLRNGLIDQDTEVHVEYARELNDANKREAIRQWQNNRNKKLSEYADKLRDYRGKSYVPTDTDLLKYQLWEEQGHICLYTGQQIGLSDLFDGQKFDIEHTVPRSVGGDSTAMNLTLCDSKFNREVKRAQLPTQLADYELILERLDAWKEKIDQLAKDVRKINTRGVADKDMKDRLIRKRHMLQLELDYWRGKYSRFTMTEVPEGFSRRQGVDIGVISKYGSLFLKSVFRHVYTVKGLATADFRKIWGLQEEYEKKQRDNHCHHAIDAVTIACIGKAEYDCLAHYYHDAERFQWGLAEQRAKFPKPWSTFTEDVKHLADDLLVSHYTADNVLKQTRKRVRKEGKLTRQVMQGDTVRASLHKDSYYGAITAEDSKTHQQVIRYVIRKPVSDVKPQDIVDPVVRAKVEAAIHEHGSLKEAVQAGIWMNRDKGIRINKVRVYASHITNPLHIRRHRDESVHDYKRTYYVANDTNYLMGIYVGKNAKGKEMRDFMVLSSLNASDFVNGKAVRPDSGGLLPDQNAKGYRLKWTLQTGLLVLLYEQSPDELKACTAAQLSKRLYKVKKYDSSGKIYMAHHQTALQAKDLNYKFGVYNVDNEFAPALVLRHGQFNALVQGQDFEINELGKITFL